MHLRRALLLFALVLGLTALATSIAPTQQQTATDSAPQSGPAAASGAATRAVTVNFDGVARGKPPQRRVAAGAHAIVRVAPGSAGQVTLPQLGRVANATALTPATFDLLTPPPGSYQVVFIPAGGAASQRIGTIVTTG